MLERGSPEREVRFRGGGFVAVSRPGAALVFFVGIVRYCLRITWLERVNGRRQACRSQPIA